MSVILSDATSGRAAGALVAGQRAPTSASANAATARAGTGKARSANLLHALSGGVAGAIAKTCTAPLARLVILYQVQAFNPQQQAPGAPPGRAAAPPRLWEAFRRVVRAEGVASLWKGNLVTIIHRVPYSSINFYTYEATSRVLAEWLPPGSDVTRRMGAGAMAGLVACTAAYPLDLVRTRLAAQTGGDYYRGIGSTLARIVADDGARGLYRGLGATLVQVVPSLAMSFTVYETARSAAAAMEAGRSGGGGGPSSSSSSSSSSSVATSGSSGGGGGGLARPPPISPAASLVCGCLSGVTTATATFPLDVVRRRMQVAGAAGRGGAALGYGGVIREILAAAGPRGFYAGLPAEIAKVVPGVAIAYGTYEFMKQLTEAD